MPYISEEERTELDSQIDNMILAIRNNKTNLNNPHDFSNQYGR